MLRYAVVNLRRILCVTGLNLCASYLSSHIEEDRSHIILVTVSKRAIFIGQVRLSCSPPIRLFLSSIVSMVASAKSRTLS